jgi:hypothetical protein
MSYLLPLSSGSTSAKNSSSVVYSFPLAVPWKDSLHARVMATTGREKHGVYGLYRGGTYA